MPKEKTDSTLHEVRFPGETREYRQARDEQLRAEMKLRGLEAAVAAQRGGLPLGGQVPKDYKFEEWDDRAHAV
jgi:predicted dithiol-disulfide oxidoreductase (DUF899 family)